MVSPRVVDQREGRVKGAEVVDPGGDDRLGGECGLGRAYPTALEAQPENLHQHAAFSDRELVADDVREQEVVECAGGEPRERGHLLGDVAKEADPRRVDDRPPKRHPNTTRALVGLVVLDLRRRPIGSLGLLRRGGGPHIWRLLRRSGDRWTFSRVAHRCGSETSIV